MKCARSAMLAAVAVASFGNAELLGADSFGYTLNSFPLAFAFEDITNEPGVMMILDNANAATIAEPADIGFSFNFYDGTFDEVYVKLDGVMSFGMPLPHPDDGQARDVETELFEDSTGVFDYPTIAVFWEVALNSFGTADQVYTLTRGTAPNREFIVQWNALRESVADFILGTATASPVTFQVALLETSNVIEMRYQDTEIGDAAFDDGELASVGIRYTGAPTNQRAIQFSSRLNEANVTTGLLLEFVPPAAPPPPPPPPPTPIELIEDLVVSCELINLANGISNALDSKLDAALDALSDANENNDVAAINALQAFINHVMAQSGNQIEVADADFLIAAAQDIIAALNSQT